MNSTKASLILFLTALIWGISFSFQSMASSFIGPFTFNSLRFLLGGLFLILPIYIKGKKAPLDKAIIKISIKGGVYCGFIIALASVVQQIGVSKTNAGKGGFLTSVYIIIVPFLSMILGKKVDKKILIAALISLFGIYLLSVKESFILESGDIFLLLCALIFAIHILFIDHFNSLNSDAMLLSCIQFLFAFTVTFAGVFFESPDLKALQSGLISILYAGIMSCSVAYTLQIVGQKYLKPTTSSIILSLESVISIIAGVLILNDSFTPRELLGCLFVFIAVLLAQSPKKSST